MKLTRVIYELFESDARRLDADPIARIHEIDGEIRLIDEEGKSTFISWCRDPVQFAVGIADASFNIAPCGVSRDMGGSEFWKQLVGKDVGLNFEGSNHQVLKIGSDHQEVYCWTSAFSDEGEDVLYISTERPSP